MDTCIHGWESLDYIIAFHKATGCFSLEHSPDCGVDAAVVELFVVQLSKERKQDLDAPYRVDGTVDGVGNNGLHVLWKQKWAVKL